MPSVLCFGDSNTHGTVALEGPGDMRRFPQAQRWPNVMAAALADDWEVIAEGHPSRTSVFDDPVDGPHKNGLRMVLALLESHRPLDLVIVMLGTNDLKQRFGLPVGDIAGGIERLCRTILTVPCGPDGTAPQVLIAAPVPIQEAGFLAEMFAGGAEKSWALAPRLVQVAERLGTGFIDLSPLAQVDPADGIHLTPEGHSVIGAAMAQKVTDMFKGETDA